MTPTREQVIEWARCADVQCVLSDEDDGKQVYEAYITDLEAFAALAYSAGIAEEREACAVAAWSHYADACKRQGVNAMHYGHWCAAALIRARAAIDQLKEQK